MNSAELALYLEAGFIDYDVKTDERFLPKILTNNQEQKVKVLENLRMPRQLRRTGFLFTKRSIKKHVVKG